MTVHHKCRTLFNVGLFFNSLPGVLTNLKMGSTIESFPIHDAGFGSELKC